LGQTRENVRFECAYMTSAELDTEQSDRGGFPGFPVEFGGVGECGFPYRKPHTWALASDTWQEIRFAPSFSAQVR
jgi:hypothetical protein